MGGGVTGLGELRRAGATARAHRRAGTARFFGHELGSPCRLKVLIPHVVANL